MTWKGGRAGWREKRTDGAAALLERVALVEGGRDVGLPVADAAARIDAGGAGLDLGVREGGR